MQIVRKIQKYILQSLYRFLRLIYLFFEAAFREMYGGILFLYVCCKYPNMENISRCSDTPFTMTIIPFFKLPFTGCMVWNGMCVWASSNSGMVVVLRFSRRSFHARMEGIALLLESVDAPEKYVFVSSVSHDLILEKYHFDSGLQYYILCFSNGDLIRFGGVKRKEKTFFWYKKEDFAVAASERKLRILQLPIIALYVPCKYVKGLRELGYHADYLIINDGGSRWLLDGEEPDFDLEMFGSREIHRAIEALIYGLQNYDVFHIHSNCSFFFGAGALWANNSDISYLRRMGKVVVSSTWGMCDDTKFGDEPRFSWHSECTVCRKLRPIFCESVSYGQSIDRSEKYANFRFTCARAVVAYPDHKWIDNPIDIDIYAPEMESNVPVPYRLPKTRAIRIYHSFGNAMVREDVKGSKFVKDAVGRLQKEGYAIEFIFFNDLPHCDIKYYQVQADIVVDQLYAGWYGSTGTECLALGKPVITYVNPDVEEFVKSMGREIPVISATPDTIYEVLKALIDNPQLREEWGKRARKFAEDYHDYRKVARILADYYEKALLRRNDSCDSDTK